MLGGNAVQAWLANWQQSVNCGHASVRVPKMIDCAYRSTTGHAEKLR